MFFNYVFVYLVISDCFLLVEKSDLHEEDINGILNWKDAFNFWDIVC